MNPFRYDLISDLILFGSNFKIQDLSIMLVASLTNSRVKNQVLQFLFKTVAGDLVLVPSDEVANILFLNHYIFLKLYHTMELKHSLSTIPVLLYH